MSLIKLEVCANESESKLNSISRQGSLGLIYEDTDFIRTQDIISYNYLENPDKKSKLEISSTPSLQNIPSSPFQRRREQIKTGSFPSLEIISFSAVLKTEKKLSSDCESYTKDEEEIEFEDKLTGKKYLVLEVLGSGYQGKVFKLKSKEQYFAGKHLRSIAEEEAFSNLRNEYNILRNLSHPNILRVYDLFEVEGKRSSILIMDYFKGRNLEEVMNFRENMALSEDEVNLLLEQLLDTLCYLHSNFVCHRDLSLTNILIQEPEWKISVIDFGLSVRMDRALMTPTGLKKYRAPEMSSYDEYNQKVDIWSCGVILLIVLTQDSLSWDRNKIVKDGRKVLEGLNHYSKGLRDLVGQMLTVESERRPSAQECVEILRSSRKK